MIYFLDVQAQVHYENELKDPKAPLSEESSINPLSSPSSPNDESSPHLTSSSSGENQAIARRGYFNQLKKIYSGKSRTKRRKARVGNELI